MTNNNLSSKVKLLLLFVFIIGVAALSSCSTSNDVTEEDIPILNPEEPSKPTKILPTLEWGKNVQTIKSMQKNLVLSNETESLLRYTNKAKTVTIDYYFNGNGLVSANMTQANISSVKDILDTWTNGYTEITSNDDIVLLASPDKSTVAYGKTLAGTNYNYASVAWSVVNSEEEGKDEYDFTPSGTIDGQDYVDLGIGIGWATSNVGASSPEKFGGYYMWAETTEHSNYNWWYYSLYTGSTSGYLDTDAFRTPYNNIAGTAYDVARKKMGSHWRMPTRAELTSLANNCDFTAGTYNNVNGIIVTGPSGKSVFIPGAGYKYKEETRLLGGIMLWSSTNYQKSVAYYLNINKAGSTNINFDDKYHGLCVRGVIDL